MVLVSSQGYTRVMVGSLWVVALCFTFLPTILDPNMTNKWSNHVDESSQYYKVNKNSWYRNIINIRGISLKIRNHLFSLSTTMVLLQHHVLQRLRSEEIHKLQASKHPKQSFCYLKSYWSFEYWLLITIGSGIISMSFFVLWIVTCNSTGGKKGTKIKNI